MGDLGLQRSHSKRHALNCSRETSSLHTRRLGDDKRGSLCGPDWARGKVNSGSASLYLGVKVKNKGEKKSLLPSTVKDDPSVTFKQVESRSSLVGAGDDQTGGTGLVGGYLLSLLKISSESPYRTPGAGLTPLINALEPDKSVRPRQGASPYRRSWGTPAVTRLKSSSPPSEPGLGEAVSPSRRGAWSPSFPWVVSPPAAQPRFPSAPREGGGPGSPSTCTSRRMVPLGWSGAGRLRPKLSRPRPLTLRPAPRHSLAPPALPLQPQPRRREVYLSLWS